MRSWPNNKTESSFEGDFFYKDVMKSKNNEEG